jgi:hypothetical protein
MDLFGHGAKRRLAKNDCIFIRGIFFYYGWREKRIKILCLAGLPIDGSCTFSYKLLDLGRQSEGIHIIFA